MQIKNWGQLYLTFHCIFAVDGKRCRVGIASKKAKTSDAGTVAGNAHLAFNHAYLLSSALFAKKAILRFNDRSIARFALKIVKSAVTSNKSA
jgi:hypothetical protein